MKSPLLIAALFVTATPLLAMAQFEHELKDLQDQRDKALAAAAEPINRRYQTALEALLRRATQGNDTTSALKIREELRKIGVTSVGAEAAPNVTAGNLTERLTGTKWIWSGGETLALLPDGKARWNDVQFLWSWKVSSAGRRIIEGLDARRGKKFTITFDRDFKTGTIEGDGPPRPTRNITAE